VTSVASTPFDAPPAWVAAVRRAWRPLLRTLGPALLAGMLALLIHALGLRGTDVAAATYRVSEVRVYGLVLWDSGWYGGNLPLGYSVVFPVVGALIGLVATGVAGTFAATWAFDRLTTVAWGRRSLASWSFAVCSMLQVAIGQLPFLTGEALGLLALVALVRRRTALAVGLTVLSTLCSPLAAAFLAMACLAWALDRADRRREVVPVVVVALALIGVLGLVFPGTGTFPFPWAGMAMTLCVSAAVLLPFVPANRLLRLGALLYALSTLGSFVIPNPLGGNAPRLAESVGIPLLVGLVTVGNPTAAGLAALRPARRLPALVRAGAVRVRTGPLRWALAGVLLVGLSLWQWAPGLNAVGTPTLRAARTAAYYDPVLHQILGRSTGPVRVEAVPTSDHWESVYLAPRLSLARGWERQLDIANNPLFYVPGTLDTATYTAWLHHNGITWVALPDTTLDYAAVHEAALLRRGVPDLRLVWSSAHWKLWQVTGGPGLVSGPAHLESLDPDHLTLQVSRPAVITVRVRYTRYWSLPRTGAPDATCVRAGADGWTEVDVHQPGQVNLAVSLLDPDGAACPQA
jgi:hypothetical protein